VERIAPRFRAVAYDVPRGCCAAYFPEANVLVPLPSSKLIPVTVAPATSPGVARGGEATSAWSPDERRGTGDGQPGAPRGRGLTRAEGDHGAAPRGAGDGGRDGARRERDDLLATEEPLEIRIVRAGDARRGPISGTAAHRVSVTMRTPGADFELAAGFLFSEGLVDGPDAIAAIRYCVEGEQQYNAVNVVLAPGARFDPADLQRNFYATSSCGVCGKASIEAAMGPACARVASDVTVSPEVLVALPEKLRAAQAVFERTGGLHGAAHFTPDGRLVRVREDVGRHNAMDKLVGAALLAGELPLSGAVVLVSGRLSFELVQKAARGRRPRAGRRLGPVQPGRGARRAGRPHPGRLRPRRALQRVRRPRAHHGLRAGRLNRRNNDAQPPLGGCEARAGLGLRAGPLICHPEAGHAAPRFARQAAGRRICAVRAGRCRPIPLPVADPSARERRRMRRRRRGRPQSQDEKLRRPCVL
jgi:FdhD protein